MLLQRTSTFTETIPVIKRTLVGNKGYGCHYSCSMAIGISEFLRYFIRLLKSIVQNLILNFTIHFMFLSEWYLNYCQKRNANGMHIILFLFPCLYIDKRWHAEIATYQKPSDLSYPISILLGKKGLRLSCTIVL